MEDELTGSINDQRDAKGIADICANFVTNVSLLPHPRTCIAHIAFKIAIILAYLFMPYLFGYMTGAFPDFILTFELITLLALADFWVVKNCAASALAGIEWYCDTTTGKNIFVHRAVKDEMFLNKDESKFFWAVMYLWPVPWALNILLRISLIDFPTVDDTIVKSLFAADNTLSRNSVIGIDQSVQLPKVLARETKPDITYSRKTHQEASQLGNLVVQKRSDHTHLTEGTKIKQCDVDKTQ
ncbi:Golgi apparatus membrane protein TVP23 [Babesia sp. Xinjiang]|uniref:Golgi apparatus membrane protein TVP23 n=1 Tax=Babesia sp. Xinjiang TaxID=462227 RepID=UPI000A24C00F|nr:Golgi apparatus membrane protein TVP23 [Babesia sp. Xinjiang]ORM40468.1 Golgi apparatus membrane protein TVP23 [Babesia sp. Xinjiang]